MKRVWLLGISALAAACLPPLDACDPNSFVPSCDGDTLSLCTGSVVVAIDCASQDLTCNAEQARCGACGDGSLDEGAGEQCDDGNNLAGDGCRADCSVETCGDGRLDTAAGESCDDGDLIAGDGCDETCQAEADPTFCGDGLVQLGAGEECDNGPANDVEGPCFIDCTLARCGDGFVQESRAEECDDANNADNDGCSADCVLEVCGDGVVQAGEACDDGNNFSGDGCAADCLALEFVSAQAPRSSAIAISDDDATLVHVNPDEGTISIFDTVTNTRRALVTVGAANSEPSSVAITPDGLSAFVALRNTGAVVRVDDIDTTNPVVSAPVLVGAEATGIMLSPTGRTAYVTSFVERSVYALDTASMSVSGIIPVGGNPRGLCMTNDGDTDDNDEIIFAPGFFSVPSGLRAPGLLPVDTGEGTDIGRQGQVTAFAAGAPALRFAVDLLPLANVGFRSDLNGDGVTDEDTGAFPNQLHSCTVNNGRVYVPNTAASPRGAVRFNVNIQAFVSVFDVETLSEVRDRVGERSGTFNLNRLVVTQSGAGGGRQFLAQTTDIVFLPGTDAGFAVSSATELVYPVTWNADGSVTTSLSPNPFFVKVGQTPIGIAINSTGTRIYTANRATRDLSVVDPATLTEVARVSSTALPTDPAQDSIRKGTRFFNTSAARWSAEGWGSCSGCHPDGYTDAVTWHFAAGPRQSIGLEAIYNKSNLSDHRILNWTGIFDEVHDFELNTRGVSGGLGAIVQDVNNDGVEEQINLGAVDTNGDGIVENQQGLNGSTDLVNDTVSLKKDWNDIDKFIQVLRPANASRQLDAAAVTRGRQVFIDNKCQNCHGGAKWSISRRSYAPSVVNSTALKITNVIATALLNPDHNQNTLVLETEEAGFCKDLDGNPANGAETCGSPLNILRITCVLRDVDTFGVFDPETGVTDKRIEVAANMVAQAQGLMGYNPPGLFNLSLSAPYLHHGQAETLEDLFTDRFASHHQSNSPTFLDNLDNAAQQGQKADLIQFLLSIDASTAPINPDAGQDICPNL